MTNLLFLVGIAGFLLGSIAYLPFGILTWLWIALQGPQQLIKEDFQINLAIVICCVIALASNRKKVRFWVDGTIVALCVLLVHSGITTFLGFVPEYSYPYFDRLWKTMLLGLFILLFMQNRTRLQAVVWVVVFSIGLLAVKAAAFSIMTAGQYKVLGPPGSQISDNNHFAGAISMLVPFVAYLYSTTKHASMKTALLVMAWLVPLGALFTYSRGGLLSLLAVAFCFWLKARKRMFIAVCATVLLVLAIPIMPSQWTDRMSTITETFEDTGKADDSVKGRFNAWYVYSQLALERPFIGGGFRSPEVLWVWQRYMPESDQSSGAKAAHNNVFQVLGEHGFLGLGIYILVVLVCLKNIGAILVRTRHTPSLVWARGLAAACGVSMIAYLTAGMTMSIPYYDLFIILVVIVASLKRIVVTQLAAQRQELRRAAPAAAAAGVTLVPARAGEQMLSRTGDPRTDFHAR
ncbi:MAG: putative O-glycosylation ligase, exosortase A system-associated [Alphaproteobacteria bacterium]|nr:putative O-glycosylation ligase, exosortase A system-associated [Alphaproteobacteria bacterium]